MTFCCFDVPYKYSPVDTNTIHNGGYPGNRPYSNNQQPQMFMPTGGNALQSYNSSNSHPSGVPQMIQVIVPPGVNPGQVLHVTVPDGSGQVIAATVPPGLQPGATFMVSYAPAAMQQPHPANAYPTVDGGDNLPMAAPISQPMANASSMTATPSYPNYNNNNQQQKPQQVMGQPYNNHNYGQQQYNPNYGPQNYNANNSGYNNQQQQQYRPSSGGNGMAPVIAGVAGAAMLAGAGALAYEAISHHNQDNNQYVDNVYDNDGGGDYGGGDFGGGDY